MPGALPAGYDEEARYFEARVRGEKREDLVHSLHAAVQPLHDSQLEALRAALLAGFKQGLATALADGAEGFADAASRWTPVCPDAIL